MVINSCNKKDCTAWGQIEVKNDFDRIKWMGRCIYCKHFKPDLYIPRRREPKRRSGK